MIGCWVCSNPNFEFLANGIQDYKSVNYKRDPDLVINLLMDYMMLLPNQTYAGRIAEFFHLMANFIPLDQNREINDLSISALKHTMNVQDLRNVIEQMIPRNGQYVATMATIWGMCQEALAYYYELQLLDYKDTLARKRHMLSLTPAQAQQAGIFPEVNLGIDHALAVVEAVYHLKEKTQEILDWYFPEHLAVEINPRRRRQARDGIPPARPIMLEDLFLGRRPPPEDDDEEWGNMDLPRRP